MNPSDLIPGVFKAVPVDPEKDIPMTEIFAATNV